MNDSPASLTTHPSLLLRVRDPSDGTAWLEFVETYGPMIFAYCRKRQLQESDAADVSQEVMLRLAKALRNFEYRPELGRFRDWLGKVIYRELLHYWNSRRLPTGAETGLAEDELECSARWNDHFHSEILRRALAKVEPEFNSETWRAFGMTWFDHLSAKDVSEKLSIGIEKVYVAKSRVLARLRAEVLRLSDDLPVAEL